MTGLEPQSCNNFYDFFLTLLFFIFGGGEMIRVVEVVSVPGNQGYPGYPPLCENMATPLIAITQLYENMSTTYLKL